jgi:hypothetical protein
MRHPGRTIRGAARSLALLSLVLGAAPGAFARIITFNVSGTFTDGAVLSGTMTIDDVAGVATAANFMVGAPISVTFNVIEFDGAYPGGNWFIQTIPTGAPVGSLPDFNLILPTATLVGYTGGSLNTVNTDVVFPGGAGVFLQSGQASPQTVTVTYSGPVVSTGAPGFQVPSFAVGVPFQVTFTYDSSTPNIASNPAYYYQAISSLSFAVGTNTGSAVPPDSIYMAHDYTGQGGSQDYFCIGISFYGCGGIVGASQLNGPQVNGWTLTGFRLQFDDLTGTAFTGVALPTGPLDPSKFTAANTYMELQFTSATGATSAVVASFSPTPIPSTQVATTASGLAYSRVSGTFNGTVTLTNIGSTTVNGPLQIIFTSMTAGVTLANATGNLSGTPYFTVPAVVGLAPGQSVTVNVQFRNPSNAVINFTPQLYSGSIAPAVALSLN